MITIILLALTANQPTPLTPTENCLEVTSKAGSTSDSLIFSMPYLRFPARYQDVRIWTTTSDLEVTRIASNKWSVRTDERSGQFSATLFTIGHNWGTSYIPVSYKWALEESEEQPMHPVFITLAVASIVCCMVALCVLLIFFILDIVLDKSHE